MDFSDDEEINVINDLIYYLAKEKKEIEDKEKISQLYLLEHMDFYNNQSSITMIIKEIYNNQSNIDKNGDNYSIDVLTENASLLLGKVTEDYFKLNKNGDIIDDIKHLLEYIQLEVINLRQIDYRREFALKIANDIEPELKKLEDKNKELEKDITKLTEDLQNSEMSIIATMGIFAGIVLTFGASTTLITGIVNSLLGASLSTFMFVIGMTGFIFSNVVIMMFYFISKLSNKNISSTCRSWSKESKQDEKLYICGNGYCNKESKTDSKFIFIFCKLWNRYFYILAINIVFALMVIFGVLTDLLIHNL